MNSPNLASLGILIIFTGFLVVLLGAILGSGGSGFSGGFILLGPIPIIFGSGPNSNVLASVALAISGVMIVVYLASFFMWRLRRRREAE